MVHSLPNLADFLAPQHLASPPAQGATKLPGRHASQLCLRTISRTQKNRWLSISFQFITVAHPQQPASIYTNWKSDLSADIFWRHNLMQSTSHIISRQKNHWAIPTFQGLVPHSPPCKGYSLPPPWQLAAKSCCALKSASVINTSQNCGRQDSLLNLPAGQATHWCAAIPWHVKRTATAHLTRCAWTMGCHGRHQNAKAKEGCLNFRLFSWTTAWSGIVKVS